MPEGPTLSLPIDASGARRGAQEFASAVQLIEAAGKRAATSIAGLNTSIQTGSNALRTGQSATQSYIAQLNSVAAAQRNAATAAKSYSESITQASSRVSGLGKSAGDSASGFALATSAVGGFVGGLTAMVASEAIGFLTSLPGQLISVADSYGRLDDRINLYTKSVKDISEVHADLLAVSSRTGTSFESTGGFFAKVAAQGKNLELTYEQMIQLTETLQQGFKVSGASATDTANAMNQLGQSFAKGTLNGDELVTTAELAPRVMDALSEAFGVSQGQIRQWAEDGELSAKAVAEAMLVMSTRIQAEAEQLGRTFGEASVGMRDAFNELLVKFDEATGTSSSAIAALDNITAWMKSPAGEQAVNDFAQAVNDLIGFLGTLSGYGDTVASALNSISGAAANAGNAIRSLLPFNVITGGQQAPLGQQYTTGGGFGGEFDTPGNISTALGDKAFDDSLSKLQLSADVLKPLPGVPTKQQQAALVKKHGLPLGSGGGGRKKAAGGAKKVDPSIAGLERARERLAEQQEDIDLFGKERDQAIDRAVESLGKYATPDMKAKSAELAGTLFDLGQLQKQKDALDSLSSSVRVFGNERAKAEESAVRQLGDFASPEQVQQARDYANQLIDLEEKAQEAQKAEREKEQMIQEGQSIIASTRTEQEEYNITLARLRELLAASAIDQETFNRAVAAAAPPTFASELLDLGNQLNSFDNQFQTLTSGIMGFSNLVSDAFTDAIFSGESFGVTMEKLGMSIAEMTTKLLIQLALQQAIGAGLQAAFAPGVAAGTAGGATAPAGGGMFGPGGMFSGRTTMARGAVPIATLPHGVYTRPTYFPMQESGIHAFARGAGLMGEDGPEAILPLKRDKSGKLGVTISGSSQKQKDEDKRIPTEPRSNITNYLFGDVSNTSVQNDDSTQNNTIDRSTYVSADQRGAGGLALNAESHSGFYAKEEPARILRGSHTSNITSFYRTDKQVETIANNNNVTATTSDSSKTMSEIVRDRSLLSSDRSVEKRDSRDTRTSDRRTDSARFGMFQTTYFRDSVENNNNEIEKVTSYRLGGNVLTHLEHKVYNTPTYFEMESGNHKMARGLGLLGEAGPEAVLPLTKTTTGRLGVRAVSTHPGQQDTILPLKRTSTGVLGVEKSFAKGGVLNTNYYNNTSSVASGASNETNFNSEAPHTHSYDLSNNFSRASEINHSTNNVVYYDTIKAFSKGGTINKNYSTGDNITSSTSYVAAHSHNSVAQAPYNYNNISNISSPSFSSFKTFAYGGSVRANLPHGMYRQPTFFGVDTPGVFPMARGTGVIGEAGPEAVLPLVRGPGGMLGVQSGGGSDAGGGTTVNVTVNNNSRADVSTENRQNPDGGTDVMITIADHVENVVATRLMRSGTKVNKAVPQVGRVTAR